MSRSSNTARQHLALVLVAVVALALVTSWTKLKPIAADTSPLAARPAGGPVAAPTRVPTNPSHGAPSAAQLGGNLPVGSVPVDKAPFDVAEVIERVQSSFETTDEGFRGGRASYGVRASEDGIALKARHWGADGDEPRSDGGDVDRHDHSLSQRREKPLESPELVLRTTYVGCGVVAASRAYDDVPSLEDKAQLVAWERENHTEHLRQTPQGVEQSWEFASKPEGRDDLLVRVDVSGLKYMKETANGLHFADARGLGFRYGHGTWIDAAGERSTVKALYENGAIELSVPREVVERSAYPAVLDPVIGPEFGLGDVFGSADGYQLASAIAASETQYLVVWQDAEYVSEGQSSGEWRGQHRATRVSAEGDVLDSRPLVLSPPDLPLVQASVASDGSDFLLTWLDARPGTPGSIVANRVTASGVVLDGSGFVVATGVGGVDGPGGVRAPSVASNGSGYLLAWSDARTGDFDVYASRVTTSGQVQDTAGFVVTTGPGEQSGVQVASNGNEYLVAWRDAGADGVYANRVGAAGNVLDAPVQIATKPYGPIALASNGNDYLLAVGDASDSSSILLRLVSGEGFVVDVGEAKGAEWDEYQVASNGTDFLVVRRWSSVEFEEAGLQASRVTASGALLDAKAFALGPLMPNNVRGVSVASLGGEYLVAWESDSVYAKRVTAAGSVVDEPGFPVSLGVNREVGPSVATNGTDFLVTWVDYRHGPSSIYGSRVSAAGVVLDPVGLSITNGAPDGASVASNGRDYLVVWRRNNPPPPDTDLPADCYILARGITAEGVLQDVSKAPNGGEDQHNPSVASNGSNYLVVWDSYEGDGIFAGVASSAGQFQDTAALSVGPGNMPEVASNGSEYLVAWADIDGILARRVSGAGKLLGKDDIAVSTASGSQTRPALASDGNGYVVVWEDRRSAVDWDIYASRVSSTGTVEDPSGLAVSTISGDQVSPQIASNGRDYLITWEDSSSGTLEIHGAQMVLQPQLQLSEFLIRADAYANEFAYKGGDRAVVSRGDKYLVTYGHLGTDDVPKIGLRFVTDDCGLDPEGDADGDLICGSKDNCADVSNYRQEDVDGDGTGDACDGCPSDERKLAAGVCGCGFPDTEDDTDGDGTSDCIDQCPNDPKKVTDFDLDVDGTLNCNDGCPTNPSKVNAGICGCNASDADTDDDGTPDCVDPCPSDEQDACVDPGEGGVGGGGGAGPDVTHAGDDSSDDGSGCGCRTAGGSAGSMSGILVLIAGIGLIASRRRRLHAA